MKKGIFIVGALGAVAGLGYLAAWAWQKLMPKGKSLASDTPSSLAGYTPALLPPNTTAAPAASTSNPTVAPDPASPTYITVGTHAGMGAETYLVSPS